MPETLSLKEAAEFLGYRKTDVVIRMIQKGELTAKPLYEGGRRRIYRRQLEELIKKRSGV